MLLIPIIALKLFAIFLVATFTVSSELFIFFINPLTGLLLAYWTKKQGANWLEYNSLFLIDILIPVFGFFVIAIFFLTGPIYKVIYRGHKIDVFELPLGEGVFQDHLSGKEILLSDFKGELIDEKLKNDMNIEPYVDILAGDDLKLKINVIEKLTRMASADAVSILKNALLDDSYEVRYFANNALEKIEKRFLSSIDAISDTIKRFPEDYRNYNFRATLYLDFYTTGLLDFSTGKAFLEKSLYDFIFSLQLNTKQSYIYVKIVHIYLLSKRYNEVLSTTEMALRQELSDEDRNKIIFYRAEANFFLKNFKEVASDCNIVMQSNFSYELIKGPSEYWARLS
ncbi:MAG: hypothetical protein Fur0010_09450 [Bdellovibrio sp.]